MDNNILPKAAALWATKENARVEDGFLIWDATSAKAEKIVLALMDKGLLQEGAISGAHKNVHHRSHQKPIERWSDNAYAPGDDHGPSGNYVTVGYKTIKEPDTYSITFTESNSGRKLDVAYNGSSLSVRLDAIDETVFKNALTADQDAFLALAHMVAGSDVSQSLSDRFNAISSLKKPSTVARELDERDIEDLQKSASAFRRALTAETEKLKPVLAQSGVTAYLASSDIERAVQKFTGKAVKL